MGNYLMGTQFQFCKMTSSKYWLYTCKRINAIELSLRNDEEFCVYLTTIKKIASQALVAHACNPSRDQEDCSLKPMWTNSSQDTKQSWWHGSSGRAPAQQAWLPEFKSSIAKKKKIAKLGRALVAHPCNPSKEADIKRIMVRSQPGQIVLETLSQKNPTQKK
jgi:hypothetical protein